MKSNLKIVMKSYLKVVMMLMLMSTVMSSCHTEINAVVSIACVNAGNVSVMSYTSTIVVKKGNKSLDYEETVEWTSDNPDVAEVDSNGKITRKSPGKATITVTLTVTASDGTKESASSSCTVTVAPQPPQPITMTTSKSGLVSLGVMGSGSVTVDWGDGSAVETKTVSSSSTVFERNYSSASLRTITLSGGSITNLFCHFNDLTSLDVSSATSLIALFCYNNQFSAASLNALFGTLNSNENEKFIYIGGNPGTDACDTSIATNKGWTVNKDTF